MKTHKERLATFAYYSIEYLVSPTRLAEAGFYYEGNLDEVKCFACNLKHKGWRKSDNPLHIHLSLSPGCTFIKSHPKKPNISETNVNGIIPHGDTSANNNASSLLNENSKNGMFNQNNSRTTDTSHQAAGKETSRTNGYSQTPRASTVSSQSSSVGSGNVAIASASSRTTNSNHGNSQNTTSSHTTSTMNNCLPQSASISSARPRYPSYAILSVRQASYVNWSRSYRQQPDEVSKAGSFYEDAIAAVKKENKELKEMRLCKVCRDYESSIVLLPCGHLAACALCALTLKNCPVCNVQITGNVRAIFSP